MRFAGHSFFATETLVVPTFANTLRQQPANGYRILGLLRVDSLHGPVKAAQKFGHAIMKRFVSEPRDWLDEFGDGHVIRQCHAKNSEEIEEVAVPVIRPTIAVAVVVAMGTVRIASPAHEMLGQGYHPGRQITHREAD